MVDISNKITKTDATYPPRQLNIVNINVPLLKNGDLIKFVHIALVLKPKVKVKTQFSIVEC